MSNVLHLSTDSFDEVLKSNEIVVVDFWAQWCPPCKALGPVIEELAKDNVGKAIIAKVDVDEEPELAGRFDVSTIPTIIYFKNGEVADKSVGFRQKNQLQSIIDALK